MLRLFTSDITLWALITAIVVLISPTATTAKELNLSNVVSATALNIIHGEEIRLTVNAFLLGYLLIKDFLE